jgi:hypothetical protein
VLSRGREQPRGTLRALAVEPANPLGDDFEVE